MIRTEALTEGDSVLVEQCDLALGTFSPEDRGDDVCQLALIECERVIEARLRSAPN